MPKILSYNIQYGAKIEEQSKWVKTMNPQPDVICYQEFPENLLTKSNDLFASNFGYEYAPAIIKNGDTYGELTAFNNGKMKLVRSKKINLGVSKIEKIVFGHSAQRSALLTEFEYQGQDLLIANIHLLCLALNKKRREQLGIVIEEFGDYTQPGIMIGDFNYTSLIGGSGLSRYMERGGFKRVGETALTHRLFGFNHQLDYVFQRNCTLLELKVENVHLSDHRPLLLEFQPNYSIG